MSGRVHILRDGQEVTVRPVRAEDIAGLLELERAVVADGRGVVRVLADLPTDPELTRPDVQEWIDLDPRDGVRLVALRGGQIVADATVRRLRPSLVRHVAVLALGVHPAVQGQGLGRLIFREILSWAREHASSGEHPLVRLELYVRADNHRARALYRSEGFVQEGLRRAFVREPDGRYHDDCVMGLLLEDVSASDV